MKSCRDPTSTLPIFPSKDLEMCKAGRRVSLPYAINGVKAFDYFCEFTIAVWMKRTKADGGGRKDIVASSSRYHYTATIDYRSEMGEKIKLRLLFSFRKGSFATTTKLEYKNFYNWQHVAVVLKAPCIVKFYLNGKEWPLRDKLQPDFEVRSPDQFRFFKQSFNGWFGFLAMVQRPLSAEEISKLMKTHVL